MFPLSADSKENYLKRSNILKTTLSVLGTFVICSLFIFYFFSDFIVSIFSGKSIPEAAKILFSLGVSFSIIAISNILLLYQLSIGKVKKYWILIVCNILELVILWLFSSSLEAFSYAFVVSSFILLIGSILFAMINRHI